MIQGLYSAASGLLGESNRLKALANNLDNLNTPGFRAQLLNLVADPTTPVDATASGPIGTMASAVAGTEYIDVTPGPIHQTSRRLDLAIVGPGFFTVKTTNGVAYTRQGDFVLDRRGRLSTLSGNLVLSATGQPIVLASDQVTVTRSGQVHQGGRVIAQLGIATFVRPQNLLMAGNGLLTATARAGTAQPFPTARVWQGYLESSNVSVSSSMADALEAFRAYQSDAQSVTAIGQALNLCVRDVGLGPGATPS